MMLFETLYLAAFEYPFFWEVARSNLVVLSDREGVSLNVFLYFSARSMHAVERLCPTAHLVRKRLSGTVHFRPWWWYP